MADVHVRMAFEYRDNAWHAFDEKRQRAVSWTVVLNGRAMGTVQSRPDANHQHLGEVGIQSIASDRSAIPRIAAGASDFYYSGNRARTRPLILVSAAHSSDPEHWTSTTLSAPEQKLAIESFRKKVMSMEQCDEPETQPIHLVPYTDDEVRLIKAYRSDGGEILFCQRLDDSRSPCGFFDDPVFFDYWFVMKGTTVRFLGTQMTPMDAADLTGTGKSAWMFQTSRGEDQDGYELFYDDFNKKASFSWTYH